MKALIVNRCLKCRTKGAFEPGTWLEHVEVAGFRFEVSFTTGKCPACGEIRDPDSYELDVVKRAVGAELARRGRCTPEAFRYIRSESLELRGVDLGELLGVGGDTISRWERGTVPLDRRAFAILGQLVVDAHEGRSEMHELLEAAKSPPPLPEEPVMFTIDMQNAPV